MRANTNIPRRLREVVDNELESGESIEWMEMPIPRFFTRISTGYFLFSIPWTAFSIFWMYAASGFKLPDFSKGGFSLFPLFGIPFVLIGLAMLSSPLLSYLKAFRTVYVITNRRAITFDGGRSITIRSYPPEKLLDLTRSEKRDGSGDIVFARRPWQNSKISRQMEDFGFLRISNPKQVEQMLKALIKKSYAR